VDHDENRSNPDNTENVQTGTEEPPFLNIVMHAVGPLDEIEPFVALGFALSSYGHRVRIATHLAFEDLVKENGLEFFDIEGGPTHRNVSEEESHCQTRCLSDLQKENFNLTIAEVSNILDGCWRSCFENSDQFISVDDASASPYFLAQAIVANPASLGHTHCAEKLGIPLHLMSTYVYIHSYNSFQLLNGNLFIHLSQKPMFSNEEFSSSNSKYPPFVIQRCYHKLFVIYHR
jgi:hypothetical protein